MIHYATNRYSPLFPSLSRNNDIDEIEFIQEDQGITQEPNSIVHVVYDGPPYERWVESVWTNWTKAEERLKHIRKQGSQYGVIEHYTLNKPYGEWIET